MSSALGGRGRSIAAATLVAISAFAFQARAADPAHGEMLFKQRCSFCHSVLPGMVTAGPNLAGVVGRKAGSTNFHYSDALAHSGLVWTPTNLDAFLSGPSAKVPGTLMPISVPSEPDRADLVAYLKQTR